MYFTKDRAERGEVFPHSSNPEAQGAPPWGGLSLMGHATPNPNSLGRSVRQKAPTCHPGFSSAPGRLDLGSTCSSTWIPIKDLNPGKLPAKGRAARDVSPTVQTTGSLKVL